LMKLRKLDDALEVSKACIEINEKLNDKMMLMWGYGLKARIQILMEDMEGAEKTLGHIQDFRPGITPPFYDNEYVLVKSLLGINQLENLEKSTNQSEWNLCQKKAYKFCKEAVNCTAKTAGNRTEVIKLMGTYYWLTNNQKKALKWWRKSITEGVKLGARPELSRTYMEVGKRLLEKKSRYHELNSISAEEYLGKAKSLFEKMDLQWDLKELGEIDL
ncbi:hypothetical protein ACFLU5_17505, partial [Bacteroidota bacterium]